MGSTRWLMNDYEFEIMQSISCLLPCSTAIVFVCLTWHLVRSIILHLLQAFVARQTCALRPPPKPDPACLVFIVTVMLSSIAWVDYDFVNIMLLSAAYAIVWFMQLYYVQAAATCCNSRRRPPPEPDPSSVLKCWLHKHRKWFLTIVPPAFMSLLILFGAKLDLQDQVIALFSVTGISTSWISLLCEPIGVFLDSNSQRWSDHGQLFCEKRKGNKRITRVFSSKSDLPPASEALFDAARIFVWFLIRIIIIPGVSAALWWPCVLMFKMVCSLFDPNLVWLAFQTVVFLACCMFHFTTWWSRRSYSALRRLGVLLLFLVVDIPSSLHELVAGDNVSKLSKDIDDILSNDVPEWTLDDESTSPSRYMHVQWVPLSVFRVYPGTILYALHTFRRWWNGFYCLSLTDPYFESVSTAPDLSFGSSDKVFFIPAQQSWRWRRMLWRYTAKVDRLLSDPFRLSFMPKFSSAIPLPSACSPKSSTLSSAVATFVSQFNPAHAGMHVVLADRLERIIQRRAPKRREVSVKLRQCRGEMLATTTAWVHPAIDVSAYNSIGEGLGAPLIVDSGASCCITPHREDFVSYTRRVLPRSRICLELIKWQEKA
jgi:hypothetical protein